ncbi:E1-like protein-activating enzyme Gsa7p/Apg7p [Batrachochytrium salamandrivorans]|nr:E1-like protein-activating enzyme Gsa7p/Apg7p [Batrachochytrium salamandrivorans]
MNNDDKIAALEQRVLELELENKELDDKLLRLRPQAVQFFPLSSRVDASFWKQLEDRKLNEYKLSSQTVPIPAAFFSLPNSASGRSWLELRADSSPGFANEFKATGGRLLNVNTMEEFKSLDKSQLIRNELWELNQALDSKTFFADPVFWLSRFLVLSFADLKRHVFVYWFAFPALANLQLTGRMEDLEVGLPGFFESLEQSPPVFFFVNDQGQPTNLEEWNKQGTCNSLPLFGLVDPSPVKSAPGWFLRSLVHACLHEHGFNLAGQRIQVICLRDLILPVKRKSQESVIWTFWLPSSLPVQHEMVTTGWEPNARQEMKPRVADLSQFLDASKVGESAVNLNLKLMKWRAFPELDDAALAKSKMLILGCGTLGCSVIRGLMGWGVKHLTLVDNGKVSHSNPVRQSLFTSADVGKDKAACAKARVLEIHPSMQVDYWSGSIPMPGHLAATGAGDIATLTRLVQACDVVFLLTDTRESRWLPTLLANAFNKLCLNAALDFDSFLVMRHGTNTSANKKLGCYFCSDVMAPRNSMRNRTLDQQCTVTRPGLAPIAGALLVELLVALMHHPLGTSAPAVSDTKSKLGSGAVPHVIRGHLGAFTNELSVAESFPQCTACSELCTREFQQHGEEFVQRVLGDPDCLDQITGLDKLKQAFQDGGGWDDED